MARKSIVSGIGETCAIDGVSFRPSRAGDFDFALELYLESTKPLLIALDRWDESKIVSRFTESFRLDQIQMLAAPPRDIGWLQLSESDEEVHIDQIHLITGHRNRGIGTKIVRALQECTAASMRRLALNVIRGNRAQALYERLGFRHDGGDEERLRMVWTGEA